HLEVYLLSCPCRVQDRTAYLMNRSLPNPGIEICNIIEKASLIGADVIGIPCNTSHSPAIFDVLVSYIEKRKIKVRLLHMIQETLGHVRRCRPDIRRIGLLCTLGTYHSGVYQQVFQAAGYEILAPDDDGKHQVHEAIYHKAFGIKSFSNPVTEPARRMLREAADRLTEAGAESIILGCTEIPLALSPSDVQAPLIDPTDILARALIREVDGSKLKARSLAVRVGDAEVKHGMAV
ncbi:MAG: aspartate/glutamate racemase family protein, partial [Thermodesulfobacteriota bacterium]